MLDLFCQTLDLATLANLCDTGVGRDGSCPAADFLTESLQELEPIEQLLDVALIYANDTITTPLSHAEMMHKAFQKANYTDEMLAEECRKFEGDGQSEWTEPLHDRMVGTFQPSHWRLLTTQFPTAVLAAWLKANDTRLQIPVPVPGVRQEILYHRPLRSTLLHEKYRVLKGLEQAEPDCVRLLEVKISDRDLSSYPLTRLDLAAMTYPVFKLRTVGQTAIVHDAANRRYVITKRLAPTDFLRLSTATQTAP